MKAARKKTDCEHLHEVDFSASRLTETARTLRSTGKRSVGSVLTIDTPPLRIAVDRNGNGS
jgi:hypothetical protein